MKFGALINDLTRSAVRKPVTEKYPFERSSVPERLRGGLIWSPENCIGCGLCAKDCPSGALDLLVIDKKAKQYQLTYRVDLCTFCAQCAHSCRQGCITLSNEAWELAGLDSTAFCYVYERHPDGNGELATAAPANP